MAFVTQIVYTISGTSDRTHPYGTIDTYTATTINDSDILIVTLNENPLTLTTEYTVDETNKDIILDAGLTITAQDKLVITRSVDIDDPIVDYTNNTAFDADDLDLANQQAIFALQELTNKTANAITLNVENDCWDGQGKTTCDFLPSTVSTGLTTLAQVNSLISGAEVATTQEGYYELLTGDGATTSFGLPSFPITDINVDKINVFQDGIHQLPTTDYTYALVGSTPTVTFTTIPANGAKIAVRSLRGSVLATLDTASVDGDAIVDGTLSVDSLDVASGADNRFLKFNTTGVASVETIEHTEISDFDAGVQANRLDQLTQPTSAVFFGDQQIASIATGTEDNHGVNKAQMDAAIALGSTAAGSGAFMEPYDTDSSQRYGDGSPTAHTVTGLTAGATYFVNVHCSFTVGSPTVSVGGVTRVVDTSGSTVSFAVSTGAGTTLTFTPSDCRIENLTGFRLS